LGACSAQTLPRDSKLFGERAVVFPRPSEAAQRRSSAAFSLVSFCLPPRYLPSALAMAIPSRCTKSRERSNSAAAPSWPWGCPRRSFLPEPQISGSNLPKSTELPYQRPPVFDFRPSAFSVTAMLSTAIPDALRLRLGSIVGDDPSETPKGLNGGGMEAADG
jgi:hypothetical protein